VSPVARGQRVRKGAIVRVDPLRPVPGVIVFQYNPSTVQRSVVPQRPGAGADRTEALRLSGPPRETVQLDVEIDAADQIDATGGAGADAGIHPQLAALEVLLYPPVASVLANAVLERAGVVEVLPPAGPLTLLVWGVKRVVPVRLASFQAREEAHDRDLNPVRATVSMELEVLTYQDLPATSLGAALFTAHQVAKESLAVTATASAVAAVPRIGLSPPAPLGGLA
jgi:hypothetical protein